MISEPSPISSTSCTPGRPTSQLPSNLFSTPTHVPQLESLTINASVEDHRDGGLAEYPGPALVDWDCHPEVAAELRGSHDVAGAVGTNGAISEADWWALATSEDCSSEIVGFGKGETERGILISHAVDIRIVEIQRGTFGRYTWVICTILPASIFS